MTPGLQGNSMKIIPLKSWSKCSTVGHEGEKEILFVYKYEKYTLEFPVVSSIFQVILAEEIGNGGKIWLAAVRLHHRI